MIEIKCKKCGAVQTVKYIDFNGRGCGSFMMFMFALLVVFMIMILVGGSGSFMEKLEIVVSTFEFFWFMIVIIFALLFYLSKYLYKRIIVFTFSLFIFCKRCGRNKWIVK